VAAAIGLLALGWGAWRVWFSPQEIVTSTGTRVRAERSWGYVRRVSFDENGDGRPEMISLYANGVREVPTHAQPTESMIDEHGTGRFNLQFAYAPGAGAVRVLHDTDGDGAWDTELSGEEARLYEREWWQRHRLGILVWSQEDG